MYSLEVRDLGKKYQIGRQKSAVPARRLNLGFASLPLPRFTNRAADEGRELWALRDVSFDVPPGTIFGLVGPNGAGKSTLLKIIARVTRPTTGSVKGRGRVVSLLELGAGFNPDFSARENILMNAAMHGIPRAEALGRMDEIIAFAEVERFIDSPLKHFSSGMYLRLAFSVAINMQPDILLADEILAVGDIAFQERCLERVAAEAKKGLAVLFVSHDMAAIARLCNQVVWLDKGQVVKCGAAEQIVDEYQEAALGHTRFVRGEPEKGKHANLHCEIASVRLLNAAGQVVGAANIAEESVVRVRLRVRKPGIELRGFIDAHVKNAFVFRSIQPGSIVSEDKGIFDLHIRLPANFLSETTYSLTVTIETRQDKELKAVLPNALTFLAYGSEDAGLYKSALLAPRLDWSVRKYLHVTGSTERKRRKAALQQ